MGDGTLVEVRIEREGGGIVEITRVKPGIVRATWFGIGVSHADFDACAIRGLDEWESAQEWCARVIGATGVRFRTFNLENA